MRTGCVTLPTAAASDSVSPTATAAASTAALLLLLFLRTTVGAHAAPRGTNGNRGLSPGVRVTLAVLAVRGAGTNNNVAVEAL